jgi:pimeloyl-ACP methyl ester carboxylesterase
MPVVVLDAGMGNASDTWSLVEPNVSKFARVCSYDRAGMGKSDRAPQPRTSQDMVDDLHNLLAKAGLNPPYVLVGHSFGGMNARLYASKFAKVRKILTSTKALPRYAQQIGIGIFHSLC